MFLDTRSVSVDPITKKYKLRLLYIFGSLGIENSIDEISIGIDSIELSSRNLIL